MADATVDASAAEVKVKTEKPTDGDEVVADPAGFLQGTVKIEDGTTIKKEDLDAKVKQEKKEEEKDIKVDGVKGEGVKGEGVKQEGNVKQEKMRNEEDVKNEMKMEGTKREDFYALATKGEGAKGEVKGETKGEMKGEGVKGESKRERSRSKKKKKKDKIKKEKADGDEKKKEKKRKKSESPGGTRKRKSKWGPDTGGFSMSAMPGGRSGLLPAAEADELMPRFSDEEMIQRSLVLENLSLSCTGQELIEFFNGAILAVTGNAVHQAANRNMSPVFACTITEEDRASSKRKTAELKFRTPDGASVGMKLNGIEYKGHKVTVKRPDAFTKPSDGQDPSVRINLHEMSMAKMIGGATDSRGMPMAQGPSPKLSIFNLPDAMTEQICRDLLSQFGKLRMLSLIRDLGTGKIKGYGIFEYDNPNDVDLAIVALNGFVCGQNVIRVQKLGQQSTTTTAKPQPVAATAMANSMTQKIVKNPVLAMQVKQGREVGSRPSTVVQLMNAVYQEDVMDDQDYDDITAEVHAEASKHGNVMRVVIPKPAKEIQKHCRVLLYQVSSRINAAVRSKALEAIAVGNLPPGKELELISALDLGTIPWNQLPVQLKEKLSLPLEDRGIDSLSLNLSVAVQAKDYANGSTVPLSRLSTFHLLVEGKFSKLKGQVEEMIVATSEGSQLPKLWHLSGATHRTYDADEVETWRKIAQEASLGEDKKSTTLKRDALKRWPHQKECLKQCRSFIQNRSTLAKRDFFVQMATGTGKSLVMADLLASISSPKRACVIVPKLDLMEQMAQLLEEMCPSSEICRVGTGWPAHLTADIFVCVRNSAWQLANLTFDLVIFDEAHHYEPLRQMFETSGNATTTRGQANEAEAMHPRTHTQQVLALNARRRIFFSATLRQNVPDFDFGLRSAIEAGVIQDYSVMVPVLSEGDPRPGLVKLIQNLPLSRKILAFCNTVQEAQAFTSMLIEAGIAADHYNGGTASMRRQHILQSFERSEIHGGIRVLVTVDVLSEGVDLPVADTCLFVAPRRGLRLRQCVGRVLRKHPAKVDALVVAPPIVKSANDSLVEDAELVRLLGELATADPWLEKTLDVGEQVESRLGISTAGLFADEQDMSVREMVAKLLEVRVLPYVLDSCKVRSAWDRAYQELVAYKGEHGHMLIPSSHRTLAGFGLGRWVSLQRQAKKSNLLNSQRVQRLDTIGFVWEIQKSTWKENFQRLRAYAEEYGHVLVPGRGRFLCGWRGQDLRGLFGPDSCSKVPDGR
eukprot:symbB.v1.2.027729.t1/scaffold2866.1/size70932/5